MIDRNLLLYLTEVARIPPLTRRVESMLWRIADGDDPEAEQARLRLTEAYLRLAVMVARKYEGRALPLKELIEASNIGLLLAVQKYDYRRGVRFGEYAVWWMRRSIVRDLERASLR
jgi:RNA polymerase primary sigma factor